MADIRPIKDSRNTSEISELCHSTAEPIFITKNGYGDLVVMSIDTYERKLAKAEEELSNGSSLLDGEEVFKNSREKYGRS